MKFVLVSLSLIIFFQSNQTQAVCNTSLRSEWRGPLAEFVGDKQKVEIWRQAFSAGGKRQVRDYTILQKPMTIGGDTMVPAEYRTSEGEVVLVLLTRSAEGYLLSSAPSIVVVLHRRFGESELNQLILELRNSGFTGNYHSAGARAFAYAPRTLTELLAFLDSIQKPPYSELVKIIGANHHSFLDPLYYEEPVRLDPK